MSKSNKKIIVISISILVILFAVMSISYLALKPNTNSEVKNLTVEVIDSSSNDNTFSIVTEDEYLGDALRDNGFIEPKADDSPTFITTVSGITADSSKQEWWSISKNDEFLMTGVDDTVINNNDSIVIELCTGY